MMSRCYDDIASSIGGSDGSLREKWSWECSQPKSADYFKRSAMHAVRFLFMRDRAHDRNT